MLIVVSTQIPRFIEKINQSVADTTSKSLYTTRYVFGCCVSCTVCRAQLNKLVLVWNRVLNR